MINTNALTKAEAEILNNLMPGNQNLLVGDRLRNALNLGMGIKDDHKWYVDGVNGVNNTAQVDGHSWATAFKTIQYAVDRCGNGVGDVIFVAPMPSAKYTENVVILDHQSLKIIAPWGPWTTRLRVGDAATKYAFTPVGGTATPAWGFIVLSRDVEICGFGIDGGGGNGGIYIGDGYNIDSVNWDENSAGCKVHDCMFLDASNYGIALDGCSGNVVIENNVFERFVYAGIIITPGGSRTVQRPIIRNNEFLGRGHGIYMYNSATTVGVVVRGNSFVDQGGYTMTYSCLFQGAGYHAFIGNFDATANGALGSATDFMSGNTEKHAMNSPVYIAES